MKTRDKRKEFLCPLWAFHCHAKPIHQFGQSAVATFSSFFSFFIDITQSRVVVRQQQKKLSFLSAFLFSGRVCH